MELELGTCETCGGTTATAFREMVREADESRNRAVRDAKAAEADLAAARAALEDANAKVRIATEAWADVRAALAGLVAVAVPPDALMSDETPEQKALQDWWYDHLAPALAVARAALHDEQEPTDV